MDVNPLCRVNEKVVFVREANEEKDHLNVLGRVGKQTVTHMHRATATFTSPDTRISGKTPRQILHEIDILFSSTAFFTQLGF